MRRGGVMRMKRQLEETKEKTASGKKRKKRKLEDRNYIPRHGNYSGGSGNIIHMRLDTRQLIENKENNDDCHDNNKENKKPQEVMTSCVVRKSKVEGVSISPNKFFERIREKNKDKKSKDKKISFRQPHPQYQAIDEKETPKKSIPVFSPGGKNIHLLNMKQKMGPLIFYDNIPEEKNENTSIEASDKQQSANVLPTPTTILRSVKEQEIFITKQLEQKTKRERKGRSFRRPVTQKQVMGFSANGYVRAASGKGLLDGQLILEEKIKYEARKNQYELQHLIPYAIAGESSQTKDNLVVSKKDANSLALIVEMQLPYLIKEFPDGFTLNVKAYLSEAKTKTVIDQEKKTDDAQKEYLEVGVKMLWEVSVLNNAKIIFEIDLLTSNKPHIDYIPYVSAFIEEFVQEAKKEKRNNFSL